MNNSALISAGDLLLPSFNTLPTCVSPVSFSLMEMAEGGGKNGENGGNNGDTERDRAAQGVSGDNEVPKYVAVKFFITGLNLISEFRMRCLDLDCHRTGLVHRANGSRVANICSGVAKKRGGGLVPNPPPAAVELQHFAGGAPVEEEVPQEEENSADNG